MTAASTALADLPTGAEKFHLAQHVIDQALERGYTVREILTAAAAPDTIVSDKTYPERRRHVRGACTVVVNHHNNDVITVFDSFRCTEEEIAQRRENAKAWREPLSAAAPNATPNAAPTELRSRKFSALIARANAGRRVEPPEQDKYRPEPGTVQSRARRAALDGLVAKWRSVVLPQLKARPGAWFRLECNIMGLPTALHAEPGLELRTDAAQIWVRWVGLN